MKIEPRGDTVIIKPIEKPTITKGGLHLINAPEDRYDEGHVLAMGPGHRLPNGERRQADVKVGDRVMYMPLLLVSKGTPVGMGMKVDPEYEGVVLVPGRAIIAVVESRDTKDA